MLHNLGSYEVSYVMSLLKFSGSQSIGRFVARYSAFMPHVQRAEVA